MASQFTRATAEIALRLQPIVSSMGLKNTASENSEHDPAVEESALTHARHLR
jgi:hypothetical protein